MNCILCVDASPEYCAMLSGMASESGLRAVFCHSAGEAIRQLDGEDVFILMLVSNEICCSDAGMQVLRYARRQMARATMPIAYIVPERDLDLARDAFQAGATEVLLRSDDELIRHFILGEATVRQRNLPVGRVLLVEDENCQAEHLQEICQQHGLGVDRCVSMEEGVACLHQADYQIAIVDILLQGLNSGLALVRHIRQLPPPRSLMPILVISGVEDAARRLEALRIGADDFLAKPFSEEEFLWRLQRITQSRSGPEVEAEAPRLLIPDHAFWHQHGLSSRESEVCKALIRGLNDKQIAQDFNISFWTVRTHITRIFTKLGVLNRRELMARYLPGLGSQAEAG